MTLATNWPFDGSTNGSPAGSLLMMFPVDDRNDLTFGLLVAPRHEKCCGITPLESVAFTFTSAPRTPGRLFYVKSCYMIASPGDKPVWLHFGWEGSKLNTVYDWVTVAIFAGLVVLFLQRSTGDQPPRDSMLQYLGASAGCAVANYLGNKGVAGDGIIYHLLGVGMIIATIVYIHIVLKPLDKSPH